MFLQARSLGEVCHIVQLAVSQKRTPSVRLCLRRSVLLRSFWWWVLMVSVILAPSVILLVALVLTDAADCGIGAWWCCS